jgi:DHA1 family tetracycline resistance protein-like MFS transporter
MSRAVGDKRQGELQGALTSIGAIAMIIAPVVMTGVFARYTRTDADIYFPGAPFLLSLTLILVALVVFLAPRRSPVAA